MRLLSIKLQPSLADLFQHCELHCKADCCGWDAFEFSELWLLRWCEFRDAEIIDKARLDVVRIRGLIAGHDSQTPVEIESYHQSNIASLIEHLEIIDGVITIHGGNVS
ncbi:DUF6331 family protein [Mariniblastus sp.]|nr:DUF6331 family protein [Mariniblastus sp.]